MNSPFHFPSLVWDEIIAIYLFLLGISAGATLLAVLLKRSSVLAGTDISHNNVIRSAAIIAPVSLIVGLTILIFHLTKPWTFWMLMFNYQPQSVMSMGVMLFQVYMLFLFLWLAIVFKQLLAEWIDRYIPALGFVKKIINLAEKASNPIELILILLSVLLGAYTGFLLSALVSYPMLNNPVLPILFLASGTSSGIAALLLAAVWCCREPTHSASVSFLHKFETPVVLIELFLLFAFFVGLYFGGGQKTVSMVTAIGGGFWSWVFWIGVVLIGLLLPLVLNAVSSEGLKHRKGFIIFTALCTLFGVFCLRFFILYTGQMTLA
ncbi:cytochrome c nitrite reductase subunit NrfD [Testudinibacter sp. TR-2022]|uniref:cytochrome c nitrite reductase subunit NrfD n=1 Tax=Testudinibacter sp. TR-2022 TaxID=2585029 RepID=UPI00111AD6D3|nr:cytochrome c nitrite reductase subunit NrfD [Testudinibacter sp. TR-2022]TNH04343.1 cytochrome c nitrite reductase subunit NrfD [Pasteurellaceae bacterium Phil31]TNH10891.1 cytochrome c nitrite reductase subunit NrfD [Testudinibacter sp. TR-2022]TNH11061.1 cytochrome c nitrite reductase subunit NrfD [Testudinibacter sp. TR-2022]TNH12341.1 cytochrome c nitrite reductase subunit NrfD [Testudinibacter sp. TR-2022]TNH19100.1 cytochrome c nitrite reductase subunit NrfD [Testudinibacter sp. TR-20